jgi:ADP-ribosylglycohydrolase
MSDQRSSNNYERQVAASAIWAAFGDALGFVTELTDAKGLQHRSGLATVETTVPWRRRIGGRYGPTVDLPAGALSDDTQLRLATSRAIDGQGRFDVEAFSKIELTVWPAYALGAGRGSLTAAQSLRSKGTSWMANFFEEKSVRYLDCGGNGAAMRIQPHVWASTAEGAWRHDALVNSIVTHGHPRGFVGAAFHGACLEYTLLNRRPPDGERCREIAASLIDLADYANEGVLGELWLTLWEGQTKTKLVDAIAETIGEIDHELQVCLEISSQDPLEHYALAVDRLGATDNQQRGSGVKTTVLASLAAALFAEGPLEAVAVPANHLGTDTDTIATMSGALVGATLPKQGPPGELVDVGYVDFEAKRMAHLAEGGTTPTFDYPSLLTWTPPKSASDAVSFASAGPAEAEIAGLGKATPVGDATVYESRERTPSGWTWVETWFGQMLLAKHRLRPGELSVSPRVQSREYLQADLFKDPEPTPKSEVVELRPDDQAGRSLHEITDAVIAAGLDDAAVGRGLREVAQGPGGIEQSAVYAGIISKALLTRSDRRQQSPDRRRPKK